MKVTQSLMLASSTFGTALAIQRQQHQLPSEIPAASNLGKTILSSSRRLDGDNDEDQYTWLAGYSLKFQGCHHHSAFNLDADEDDGDVMVQTSKLAHFRLCPADSCATWLGGGCSSNYGDYVVDLSTFAKAFVESSRREEEYVCQTYVFDNCDCSENDDKDDNFDRDYCEYDCFIASKKMTHCIDRNPYDDDENSADNQRFEVQEYAECKEWELPEFDDDDAANNNRRSLEEDEEQEYYIGPYCAKNGGAVYLGLFSDDTCTNFADENNGITTYKELSRGQDLPYSAESLITSDCVQCIEKEDPNRNSGDNEDDDAIEVSRQCEELYYGSGKCESAINADKAGKTSDANDAACHYINGIQFTKTNGIVEIKTSKLATFFVVAFAAVFAGLASLVFKLRKEIDDAKQSPLLEKEDSQEDAPLDTPRSADKYDTDSQDKYTSLD